MSSRSSPNEVSFMLNYRGKKRLIAICEKIHKILTPVKTRRYESPNYIRRYSRVNESSFVRSQNLSINQTPTIRTFDISVQGSTLRSKLKVRNNFRNTARLITRLPVIKPDNL